MKGWMAGLLIILWTILFIGFLGSEFSHNWSDTGTINWVGQKQFVDSCPTWWASTCTARNPEYYVYPYSVQTLSHGTFNFTWHGANGIQGFCGNAELSTDIGPSLRTGTPVALIKINCGGYDLVIDR